MSVYEDPDELGYRMSPLSRSAAQEDIGDQFRPEGAQIERTGLGEPFPTDLLPWDDQQAISWAARHAHVGADVLAADFRDAGGYS